MPHYPDTIEGVRAMLLDDGTSLVPSTFTPDPHVHGCWKVDTTTGETILAYVGDHPFAPDFEVVE